MPSGSLKRNDQPPCFVPSEPPGSSTTPSREMNSVTTILRMLISFMGSRGAIAQTSDEPARNRHDMPGDEHRADAEHADGQGHGGLAGRIAALAEEVADLLLRVAVRP